jgi:hypothetical protein
MKNQLFSVFTFLLLFAAGFTSCAKEAVETGDQLTLSDEEALDILSGALVLGSEGITADAMEAAYIADGAVEKNLEILECGETADSLFTRTYNDLHLSAYYSNYLTWGLSCTEFGLPSSLSFTREMDGSYETARLLSTDEAASEWTISQLLTGPNYILNGSYVRTGQQGSKVREMRTFTSTVSISVDKLNVDKGKQRITSGLATFQLTGNINDESAFSFTGDIVFLGDGSATVIINGNSYAVDLF